ncbi:MAG TPA: anti-sigma factor [Streptosporangiaceae bacterium]|nr:anti-sigma factor [Streptosporangiaceae bacterium]
MTPQEWLAGYLEHGVQMPGMEAPDAVTADAAQRLRVLLASPDLWREPPRGLLDQVTASIGSERTALTGPQPAVIPRPANAANAARPTATKARPANAANTARKDSRHRSRVRRPAGAAAAALLAAAAVVIGIVVTRGPVTTDVVLAGTRLAPAASAVAKLHATPSGLAIELDVSGLPPSPPGSYYQAWMKGPHGLVTIGTFHLRGGPGTVELWSAVSLTGYPTITVTREPEDGNPASSGQVVLTSRP